MASQDWLEKDFYRTLGVAKDVSDKELTKTYHKLAHKYHPDSNPGDKQAEAKFKEISEAYSVLSDKQQRQEYDQIRAMGAGGARFTGSGHGFEDVFGGANVRFGNAEGFGGLGDIFNMFTGGAGFSQASPGRDVHDTVTIDFLTSVTAGTVTLQTKIGPVRVRIPAGGYATGKKLKLRGKGEPSPNGGPNGNLLLTIQVRPHPVFSRDGKNLRLQLPVTFLEATLGATVSVPTLGGDVVKLKIAPGTPSGRQLRVKGRGLTTPDGQGDLLAEVQVVVPATLTDEEKLALEAYAKVSAQTDPRADMLARAK